MDRNTVGLYIWGIIVPVFCAFILYCIFSGEPDDSNKRYKRVRENASIIAAMIAAGALGWSWFYQTTRAEDRAAKEAQLKPGSATTPSKGEQGVAGNGSK